LQPYHDIAKLLRKETMLPEGARPVFRVALYRAFACFCVVLLLIPVLTSYRRRGRSWATSLAGGLILARAS